MAVAVASAPVTWASSVAAVDPAVPVAATTTAAVSSSCSVAGGPCNAGGR